MLSSKGGILSMPKTCLDEAKLSWNYIFSVSSQETFLAYNNVSISKKKDLVHKKSYFSATQI